MSSWSQDFVNAVSQKDTRLTRIMLQSSLMVDPSGEDFKQRISFVQKAWGTLWDAHDGKNLNIDSATWTKGYMDEQMFQSTYNFSEERISHLQKVVKHIFSDASTPGSSTVAPGVAGTAARTVKSNVAAGSFGTGALNSALTYAKKNPGATGAIAGAAAIGVGIGIHRLNKTKKKISSAKL